MFDDLDDDDVTDLIPDKATPDEEERLRQQAVRGRRMTVSEVRIFYIWEIFRFEISRCSMRCCYILLESFTQA